MIYDGQRKAVRTEGGRWLHLSPLEAALLERLMKEPGQLVRFDALMAAAWGERVSTTTLHIAIKRVRDKLPPESIMCVIGFGYMLAAEQAKACPTCGRSM